MIFKDFANRWLGSKSKLKVALYFFSGRGPTGERELSRIVGLSHVAVGKILKDMKSVNFLNMSKIGNVNVWSLNEKSYAYKHAKDLQSLAKTQPLMQLKKDLEADFGRQKNTKKVILFGSISEGLEKEASDIDVFIMVDKTVNKKIVSGKITELSEKYRELYGNNISPTIMTETELNENKSLKENIERGIMIA